MVKPLVEIGLLGNTEAAVPLPLQIAMPAFTKHHSVTLTASIRTNAYFCPMDTPNRFAIHTLGCKLNFSESSAIAATLCKNGFSKVPFKEQADVYIINTCSVTQEADKECRQIVRSVLRRSPDAFIAVTGCYAQLKPQEIAAIEGVDVVLGAAEKFNLPHYLQNFVKKDAAEVYACSIEKPLTFQSAYSSNDRTRSFLKVQDGCNYNCTYCTIPLARGHSRSDAIENVVRNVYTIAANGTREIVLTGVNIGDFGIQAPNSRKHTESFFELVQKLENVNAPVRYRISSIEPNLLTNEIIEFIARAKKFVPHFHIPLQSGCDKTLKAMRRRYLSSLYAEKVALIKLRMPHACIGADVITGFPDETDKDFLESYRFITETDLSYLHVFTYSERTNTLAATSHEAVPIEVRKKRNKMLHILSEKKLHNFYAQNLNMRRETLFETENKQGWLYGYTDNYIRVKVAYRKALVNSLQQTTLTSIGAEGTALAEVADNAAKPIKEPAPLTAVC